MANSYRSGADGMSIALGIQSAIGTPVASRAGMLPYLFPVSEISLGEAVQVEENDLVTAFGADVETEIGQLWADGGFTTRILVNHFIHILRGVLNPDFGSKGSEDITVASGDQAYAESATAPTAATLANKTPMVSSPGSTEKYAFPCKLQLVLTGSPTVADDAKMVIIGRRRGGRGALDRHLQREEVALTETGGTSDNFYIDIDDDNGGSITFEGVTGTPTYALNWVPDTEFIEVTFRTTDVRFTGYMCQILKGGQPDTVQDYVPTSLALTANNTGIRATLEGLGTRYEELRTVDGGLFTEMFALSADDIARYTNISTKSMPGWAGALLFGDRVIKYNSLDINVNRNLDFAGGIDGEQFRSGVQPTQNRQVTFVPTALFESGDQAADTFARWQRIFRNNERSPMTFQARAYNSNGRELRFEASTPSGQITDSVRVNAQGQGALERRIPLKALPTAGQTSEITFRFWMSEAFTP